MAPFGRHQVLILKVQRSKHIKKIKNCPYICDYAVFPMYADPRRERMEAADAKRIAETPFDVWSIVCRIVEHMGLPVETSETTYP